MDYGSSAIEIIPDVSGVDAWASTMSADAASLGDPSLWATEDDYRDWNAENGSDSVRSDRHSHSQSRSQSQSRAGSEQPPSKRQRSGGNSVNESAATSKPRSLGKMFYKTKLCCKFRAGTCPYITNCNFAHGMEELRKPPANWQEIVAAHEESVEPPREEHKIPILSSADVTGGEGMSQRSYKGRHCKRFYSEEGCPYGEACTFLHDELSKERESVTISLSPIVVGSGGGGGGGNGPSNVLQAQKPSNWKTRICNKWETTKYCPFGSKCHFAHGAAELHKFGTGYVDSGSDATIKDSSVGDSKPSGIASKASTEASHAAPVLLPHADTHHAGGGVPSQRSGGVNQQRQGPAVQRPVQRWKGPHKISGIYGDWIEETD